MCSIINILLFHFSVKVRCETRVRLIRKKGGNKIYRLKPFYQFGLLKKLG
jgi:hypothetical protein